jgi:hypothetical protein
MQAAGPCLAGPAAGTNQTALSASVVLHSICPARACCEARCLASRGGISQLVVSRSRLSRCVIKRRMLGGDSGCCSGWRCCPGGVVLQAAASWASGVVSGSRVCMYAGSGLSSTPPANITGRVLCFLFAPKVSCYCLLLHAVCMVPGLCGAGWVQLACACMCIVCCRGALASKQCLALFLYMPCVQAPLTFC